MIVAVLNQKGGAGKTTLALNLAAALNERRSRVLLVDTDPQETAQDWASVRETAPPFSVMGFSKPVLHRDLPALSADYDHTIIDGTPRNYDVARSAILASDVVLIPVQPSGADFWATRQTVKLIEEARPFKETQKAVLMVSRKVVGTVIGRDILEALAEFDLPVMAACTSQRVAFAQTLTIGSTVIEGEPKGAAAREIRGILKELESIIG